MTRQHVLRAVVVLALAGLAVFAWRTREGGEERTIRERIEALRTEVNASTGRRPRNRGASLRRSAAISPKTQSWSLAVDRFRFAGARR